MKSYSTSETQTNLINELRIVIEGPLLINDKHDMGLEKARILIVPPKLTAVSSCTHFSFFKSRN